MDSSNPTNTRQISVNLFTRSDRYAIPQSTYLIPSDWRRFQLSELINKVLGHGPDGSAGVAPVPFDFVVEGEVLRGSLGAWAARNRGDDEESAINVEYLQSVLPPSQVGRWEQEDWISGLSLRRPGHILASSYLSTVQVMSRTSASPLYTLQLPTSLGATSCTWVSPCSTTEDILVAAGGVDRNVHVFSLPSLDADVAASEGSTAREVYTLMGHTGPISSVASPSSSSSAEVLSASWDGALHIYVLPDTEPEEHQLPAEPVSYLPGQKKRRRLHGDGPRSIEGLTDGDAGGEGGWRRAPDVVMRGHIGRIGGAIYDKADPARIWSAGWDGAMRGWSTEGAAQVVRQGPSDKALLCLDQFTAGPLVAGSMDRTVTLWDMRAGASSLIAQTINVGSPVPSVTCHPTSPFTLAAATYSGNVQIWDVRSPKHALFSVRRADQENQRTQTANGKVLGERLLAVDWDGELLVAGGEDGEIGLWHARGE